MSPTQHQVHTFSQTDQRRFISIPLEIPAETARIDITYTVQSEHLEGCAIDIGLRDPVDWRGWSGSARQQIVITPYHTTPGYALGPIVSGTWEIVLGLYQVPESGCTVEVSSSVQLQIAEWLTGDLHTHTVHSDGQLTVPELCAYAVEQGLEYVAITDHNTVSQHHQEATNVPLLLLPGVELTTYSGHANLLGLQPPVRDFRNDSDEDFAEHFRAARSAGAVSVVNHPFDTDCGWEHRFDHLYDALEIWNGGWDAQNAASLELWQLLLVSGRRLIALGGSDFHGLIVPGEALPVVTRIFVQERSVGALLAGLQAGQVVVARGIAAPRVDFTLAGVPIGATARITTDLLLLQLNVEDGQGARLRLISDRGREAEYRVDSQHWTQDLSVSGERYFYRVELWSAEDPAEPLVITNPVYLERH